MTGSTGRLCRLPSAVLSPAIGSALPRAVAVTRSEEYDVHHTVTANGLGALLGDRLASWPAADVVGRLDRDLEGGVDCNCLALRPSSTRMTPPPESPIRVRL